MAENGAASGATEVTATVEPGPKGPTISDLQAAFDKLSPEEKSKIVQQIDSLSPDEKATIAQIGQNLQQRMAADPTAGRPAVASPLPAVQAAAAAPAAPTAAAPTPPTQVGPDLPTNDRPPGFSPVPENIYQWTATASEGRPLWGHLIQGRERTVQSPGRLVFKLLKPAYALTRAGKKVLVPVATLVWVRLTDSLEPILQLTGRKEGCAAVWMRALAELADEGGCKEYAYDVCWEHEPNAPNTPHFWAREVLGLKSA